MLADQPCKYHHVNGYRRQFSSSRFHEARRRKRENLHSRARARSVPYTQLAADLNPINTPERAEPRGASLIKKDQLHDREILQLVGKKERERQIEAEGEREREREKESEMTSGALFRDASGRGLLSQRDVRRITASSRCNLIGRNTRSLIKHSTNY